jgi:amino acid adenylation domain-containing protein
VASFIGALKAGCTYVPLDPAGPAVRTADILRRCEPRVILTEGCDALMLENLASRGALGEAQIGWLDGEQVPEAASFGLPDVERAPAEPPLTDSSPQDIAYILFTSGTTGSPKGVPISHASIRAFIEWVVAYFQLGPEDRVSGHTALTFDLSTFDIYAALAAGAELHHVPRKTVLVPHEVSSFIEQRRLTLWCSVPSELAYVARFDALRDRNLGALRHVACCGDVLAPKDLTYWRRHLPRASFTNLYGPTETTVASSYYRVPADFDEDATSVPIGLPCPGEELLLLDDTLRPVADGEVGDIYITGVGLSPGYWRDLENTRAAFLPDPRPGRSTERVHRTGDQGYRDPDGAIHFLARSDFLIKTSGYRVKPAEVEKAVRDLEEVAACAVVPVRSVEGFTGSVVACAYVPSNGALLRTGHVKKRLADRLPGYMVPSRWLVLPELPLDGRGKIDRRRVQLMLGDGR